MRFGKIFMAVAAVTMSAAPVAASAANPAAKLSVAKSSSVPGSARASTADGKSKALGGGVFILILAAAAVAAGIVAATSGDSTPDSN